MRCRSCKNATKRKSFVITPFLRTPVDSPPKRIELGSGPSYCKKCQKVLKSPWKVGIGVHWRTLPIRTGDYRRTPPIHTRCYRRTPPICTGCHRRTLPICTGCYRQTLPSAPGITGGPIRGHKICCNQSQFPVHLAEFAKMHWVRLADSEKSHQSQLSTDCKVRQG